MLYEFAPGLQQVVFGENPVGLHPRFLKREGPIPMGKGACLPWFSRKTAYATEYLKKTGPREPSKRGNGNTDVSNTPPTPSLKRP